MPISVVVGGQFGSEGKGKVSLHIALRPDVAAVVRVGGTNSGHTAVGPDGTTWALRQLPASILAPNTIAVLPAGAIIDPEIFFREVRDLGLGPDRVYVSKYATLIAAIDKAAELSSGLTDQIGSTGSGTGAALMRRMLRRAGEPILAQHCADLAPFLKDTDAFMSALLSSGKRIVIEGSQGFGLSLLHGGYYPNSTSRDTTAGTFVGEAGLSPRDVDDIVLVIRTYPIRVAGASGPLLGEMSWDVIARRSGRPLDFHEKTTATHKIRRVGQFDPVLVRRAIQVNQPNSIVVNHFDYVDRGVRERKFNSDALTFLSEVVEKPIGRTVDLLGISPSELVETSGLSR
jgi:adenylosuccinate synthase